jgi:hypothetical protein
MKAICNLELALYSRISVGSREISVAAEGALAAEMAYAKLQSSTIGRSRQKQPFEKIIEYET